MESTQNRLNELWNTLFVPAWNWFTGLDWAILFAAVVLNIALWFARRPLAEFLITAASWVGNAIGIEFNETVKKALRPSVRALVVVIGVLLGVNLINPPEVVSDLLEKILNSILVAAVFAAIYAFCDPFAKALEPYRNAQSSIQIDWVIKAMKFLTIFVGVAAVLKIWGIDIGPILTGMGVVGAALALAAQDILKNLLAGITSMGEKRFSIGEWIRVEGVVEGTVEDVDFRSTLIRRFDLAPVYVPNAQLAESALTNFSRMSHRRILWKIAIVHSATTDQLRKLKEKLENYLANCGDFADPKVARRLVRIDSINESSIDMLVYCFTETSDYQAYQDAKERLVVEIRKIVCECGTSFAYPSQSIYVELAPTATEEPISP